MTVPFASSTPTRTPPATAMKASKSTLKLFLFVSSTNSASHSGSKDVLHGSLFTSSEYYSSFTLWYMPVDRTRS